MSARDGLFALLLSLTAGCTASPARPVPSWRSLDRSMRLVRLTARGPSTPQVVLPRGGRILFLNEREDGPVAVVLHRLPRREFGSEGSRPLTPVPLGPGQPLALRGGEPGEYVAEVHPAEGSSFELVIVVEPR